MNRIRLIFDEPVTLVLPNGQEVMTVRVDTPNPDDDGSLLSVMDISLPGIECLNCYDRTPRTADEPEKRRQPQPAGPGPRGDSFLVNCNYVCVILNVEDY